MKEPCVRFRNVRVRAMAAFRRRAAASRLLALACASFALLFPAASALADAPDFSFRPLLAGKASLAEPGFVVRRGLGVAALAPDDTVV